MAKMHCPKTLELYRMYTCALMDIKNPYSLYNYCAALELKHFTPNSENWSHHFFKVILASAINFHLNWSLAFCVNIFGENNNDFTKIHRFDTIVLTKLFDIIRHDIIRKNIRSYMYSSGALIEN